MDLALLPTKTSHKLVLPSGETNNRKPEILDAGRTLLLPDIHIPYHSKKSLSAAISAGVDAKVDAVVLTGDQADFYELSRYDKDPRKRPVVEEMEMLRDFLTSLRGVFPTAKILYMDGNHEQRLVKYIQSKASALAGLKGLTLPENLDFKTLGIQHVTGMRGIKIGKLRIMHGHELGNIGSSINPARGAFLKAKSPVIVGHCHRKSEHAENTLEGKSIPSWSMGCLCDLSPDYMPVNNWCHGFAIIELSNGHFRVNNHYIAKDGKIY